MGLPVPVLWAQCAFKRSTGWICFYGWSKQIAASWTSQMHGNSSKLWGPPRAIAVIFALWIGSKNCISWSGKMVGPFNQSMVLFAGRIEVWHPDNAEIYSDSEKESEDTNRTCICKCWGTFPKSIRQSFVPCLSGHEMAGCPISRHTQILYCWFYIPLNPTNMPVEIETRRSSSVAIKIPETNGSL
jgi:hypothetical protein